VRLQGATFVFDGPGWTVVPHAETFVDGFCVGGEARAGTHAVVRMGSTVVLLSDDIRRFIGAKVAITLPAARGPDRGSAPSGHYAGGKLVAGPTLRERLDLLEQAARAGQSALISGEAGTGKTLAARIFHEAAARNRPFVEVEGAALTRAHVEAARGGTLFLDDVDLMPPPAVETLAGTSVRVVAASRYPQNAPRVFDVEVRLPALRERREDIPFLLGRRATAELVETMMLESWPGNVAELLRTGEPRKPSPRPRSRRRRGS
jgi:transcriptional regulator of acetoin/glycerol metabolism